MRSRFRFVETYDAECGKLTADDISNIVMIEFDCRPGAVPKTVAHQGDYEKHQAEEWCDCFDKLIIGGPQGDAGLTGRKIIIDICVGWGAHGGGALSGKDPTKVDGSAAYICRQMAKSLVKSSVSTRASVQLSYAIGVAKPLSFCRDL